MPSHRLLWLVAAVSLVLVVAAGASRASYPVAGGEAPCPDRVWRSALEGLADDSSDPGYACTVASQERLFAVAASLMGLVIVSGLLSRGRD